MRPHTAKNAVHPTQIATAWPTYRAAMPKALGGVSPWAVVPQNGQISSLFCTWAPHVEQIQSAISPPKATHITLAMKFVVRFM